VGAGAGRGAGRGLGTRKCAFSSDAFREDFQRVEVVEKIPGANSGL